MYAVLYVADFYLQSVLRADPTLASQPTVGAPQHETASPIQEELLSHATYHESEAVASERERDGRRVSTADAINGASFNLPRGTGSARGTPAGSTPPMPSESNSSSAVLTSKTVPRIGSDDPPDARPRSAPPLAIIAGDTKKSLILQINSRGRSAGVEIGMTTPQAQARCGDLVLRQRSSSAEAEAQYLLLACALDVAPLIEDTAPGICTIDISGLAPEDRSRHVARAVCHLREQGLHATGGLAATPLLALYAAQQTTSVRTIENANAFLHPLPLSVADPSSSLAHILTSWGISTLGQFTALPKQEVVRRLGTDGHALWERARGGEPRPLRPYARAQEFAASLELEYELETCEGVLFILRRFVDRLALELRTAGHVAAELALGLKLVDETRHERSFRLPEPTAREDILFRTLHTYLESLRTDSAVIGVSLQISPVRPLARQPGLFETGLRDPHGFSETLARVTAIVGSGQLGTPALEDSYRPDAVKLVAPTPVVPALDQPPIWPPLGLPLRRYRPPQSAHVEVGPKGHPCFISGAQIHSPITAYRGPWRSSGDWWKPEAWAREEWDIELAVGGLYRISRVQETWYLDGEYE